MSLSCCCDWFFENDERLFRFDWSKLPDDLTVEILCRVPEKPLIRFKCVSKAWNFWISNVCVPRISASAPLSGFLFRWTTSSGSKYFMDYTTLDGICGGGFVESYLALLPFQPTAKDFLDCCNGLLLFVKQSTVPTEYYVCNPATKQCVAIPVSLTHLEPMYAALAFSPLESLNYKIVRLGHSADTATVNYLPRLVDVFSSDTGNWVTHTVPFEPQPQLFGFNWIKHCVYSDGVLHALSRAMYLLCFNLKEENVNARAIKLPLRDMAFDLGFIGVSKGSFYYANHVGIDLLVWSLEFSCSKAGQWILKHIICIHDLAQHPRGKILKQYRFNSCLMLYALHPTSEVFFLGLPFVIFSYHPKTNQLKVFCDLEKGKFIMRGQYSVFPYSRCPVVLNDFTQRNLEWIRKMNDVLIPRWMGF